MWDAYWQAVRTSPFDWVILAFGGVLIVGHMVGLVGRFHGRRVVFVQQLDIYRTFLLLVTELLPVLGLLATTLSLLNTFKTFQAPAPDEAVDLSRLISVFAPGMSATISGLMMIIPNLVLNAILWLSCPAVEKGEGQS
jgi:hypothetical protein